MNILTKVYTDAGYSKLGVAPIYLGMVVDTADGEIHNGKVLKKKPTSSTQAEYISLIWAMSYCLKIGETKCHFMCDNQTMVRQIQGQYKVHAPELLEFYELICKGDAPLYKQFEIFRISHISRKYNKADKIVQSLK